MSGGFIVVLVVTTIVPQAEISRVHISHVK